MLLNVTQLKTFSTFVAKSKTRYNMNDTDKMLVQMTGGELRSLVNEAVSDAVSDAVQMLKAESQTEKTEVYGVNGLCEIFHCGPTQAMSIKQSHAIDTAITMVGKNRYKINVAEATRLWNEHLAKRRKGIQC